MKLVSVAEMVAIEREANARGLSYERMMENAGTGLGEVIHDAYSHLSEHSVLGLIGSGNNGGDTLVALSFLAEKDWKATAYIVRPRPAGDRLMERFESKGGRIFLLEKDPDLEQLIELIQDHWVLLDGVLGTGIQLPLKGRVATVLDKTRELVAAMAKPPAVVAVDCPSGVDCDSGQAAEETIPADLTVTMAAVKKGLLEFPAFQLLGKLELVGIGLAEDMELWRDIRRTVPDTDWVRARLPKRPLNAHKGTFGTALVVGGCANYTGAVLLAGKAAYRIGAGLVTLAIPKTIHTSLAGHFPEATWLPLSDQDGYIAEEASDELLHNLERATAMLIGPGFGLEEASRRFIFQVIEKKSKKNRPDLPPLVMDADGLKLLAQLEGWPGLIPPRTVLTPHPGEMSVLTGLSTAEIQANRMQWAEKQAREWGHVLILKGACTVVAGPDGRTAVVPMATPALARAGTGDVLAGLVVGLRAQGVEAFEAAVLSAWIHAQAGIRAAARLGSTTSIMAGDVLEGIIEVMRDLDKQS